MVLPDIQETEPKIKIPIRQVGVENVTVPFMLESRESGFHSLISKVSLRTDLEENIKGISMSRLLLTLKPYLDLPLKHKLIREILEELQKNIGSKNSYIKFEFSFPMNKQSPATDNSFPIYYNCSFEGQLTTYANIPEKLKKDNPKNFRFFQGVTIQYASYCPCSAELCKDLNTKGNTGFPHAQRSFAKILIETVEPNYVWLEDIINNVESVLATVPYPIIKRIDEQEIARIASENPMFVEDAIRLISNKLNDQTNIHDWIVKCVHEESIHTSEAIAINYKGTKHGFNWRYFL